MTTDKTSKYGIIGWPVAHSVSPPMQMAAFTALKLDASYDRIAAEPSKLAETVTRLRESGYAGWNVTVPHKQAILPLLDEVDSTAEIGGSINTVAVRDGKLMGYSTDGYGLEIAVMEAFGVPVSQRSFLFWGAGGAATAAACYFASLGAARIIIVNRTREKANALADKLGHVNSTTQREVIAPEDYDQLTSAIKTTDVVVQSTSLGLHADDPVPIPPDLIAISPPILDMIYGKTKLQEQALAMGVKVADGSGMLLHQGAKSFVIWTGLEPPIDVMRAALRDATKSR